MVVHIQKILEKTSEKINPSKKEQEEEKQFSEKIIQKIKKLNPKIDVVLAGSVSRQTHVKGDRDIDVFVLFDESVSKEEFKKEGLRIGKQILKGHEWEKAYSQHPYIRGKIEGFEIEIVPGYKIKENSLIKSAVDRTPLHTKYIIGKLNEKQKDEVRLLRQFLKGINCYGAELKSNSMPGYLVELLILNYGSFEKTIKAVSEWKEGEIIDLEGRIEGEIKKKKFDNPLIVIDPVDENRNVASALSHNQFARFIAASRAFMKNPSEKFFFEHKRKLMNEKKAKEILNKKELIALKISYPKELADIVWGQLNKFEKRIHSALIEADFIVNRTASWTDEKKEIIVLMELESLILQKSRKLIGPMVWDKHNGEKFIEAHKKLISGPRIEKGKWIIETERKYIKAEKFVLDYIKKLKKQTSSSITRGTNKGMKVMNEKDLIKLFKQNKAFARFFSDYLIGKEVFL
ncbi:MAG: CCA tRNA nucleotidyltransferase [Candidatus Diapherotrites archaeon]